MDAALLEARRSFFSGGFLAVDHVASTLDAARFLAASLLIDASVIGALVAAALWLFSRTPLSRMSAAIAAGIVAILPIGAANMVEYRLLDYFGDAFDVGLMFDLAGRDPGEVVAVSSPQLWLFGGAAAVLTLALCAAIWILARRRARAGLVPAPMIDLRTVAAIVVMSIALGAVVTVAARTHDGVLDNGIRRKPAGRFTSVIVNVASDFDRDGFGLLGRPPDPDLFDAHVQPYALDLPGDGIDQDGIAGDLPAGTPPYVEKPSVSSDWRLKPDVVLIVLESFRSDAVGATVDGHPVTPVLDALGAAGVRVERAYSHNGYTVQSRRHIFSGSAAGLNDVSTMVDDFKAQGYQTAYFSAQDESFGGPEQGVGFERADVAYDARADRDRRYSSFTTAGSLAVSHEVLNARIAEFLGRRDQRPLFLYVNFHDTHFPYHHRDIEPLVSKTTLEQRNIVRGRAAELREMYLNTASNVDRAIGALLTNVRSALGHEPGVIVLSDHGESLFEEGFLGHGYALNDAQTRIPLIVSGLPLTIREPFGQSDLRPLLHEALAGSQAARGPAKVVDPSKRVFQYLGNLGTAAQIGFVTTHGRVLYDVRSRQARVDGGAWRVDGDLAPAERASVTDLIHTWERMLLARQRSPAGRESRTQGGQ